MAGAFLILLREGFEAALVVGLILAVLGRLGRPGHVRYVYAGVIAAGLVSLAFARVAEGVSGLFDGAGQEVLNGIVLAAAAGMITYVVVWVRGSKVRIEERLSAGAQKGDSHRLSVFVLAFLAVFREGAESVLFLWGILAGGRQNEASVLLGAGLGLAAAVLIAWLIIQGGRRVPMRPFFNVTTALLVLLSAGMVGHAVGFWVAVDWLPGFLYPVWDTSAILPERTGLGQVLTVLIGYNANPSLTEVLAYAAYLAGVGLWLRFGGRRRDRSAAARPA
jgi:high-affinity iron transporter